MAAVKVMPQLAAAGLAGESSKMTEKTSEKRMAGTSTIRPVNSPLVSTASSPFLCRIAVIALRELHCRMVPSLPTRLSWSDQQ